VSAPDEPDLLLGAAAITAFINKLLAPQKPVSQATVYRWIENKHLPVGRIGSQVIGSPRVIRRHLERLAGGGEDGQ
jgi:hypothetical protein